jgi:hypothetical protein
MEQLCMLSVVIDIWIFTYDKNVTYKKIHVKTAEMWLRYIQVNSITPISMHGFLVYNEE